ncbi:MAG: UDP-N-acetyl-D-glucosamine 6-dehydrogenase [Alphaproteobacteria bacterium MarineAlpha11_Bin1]|nr:MAG: UDP-N-acetyl-D-glucosamine 6-dehydrogenase [Alphaproteobacteria bacterium MarineAlpha11_Bin1]|tara:strand:- start:10746 stop:12029 length:1284 start_codon:yes stop_codon:yes gene_type:complete
MDQISKIVVVGLGYVGLPLAVSLARSYQVTGFDINAERIRELQSGKDRTREVEPGRLSGTNLLYSADIGDTRGADVYIVTVPTPVSANNQPDLSAVRRASEMVGEVMATGTIVVYESTVYPGVTEDVCGPILEESSGLKCGTDFFLGYSPERINPGDRDHTVDQITKVVAGQTPQVTETLCEMYNAVTSSGVFCAADIKTAEAAKVIENAQRDINIAFVNEVATIFHKTGVSIHDVLEAASTKWNFLDFKPGLVGGHCIGVDPFYLAHAAVAVGHHPEIVLAGRRINDAMGPYIAECVASEMAQQGHGSGARILVLGLTFKENVPDLRNSRVIDIITALKAQGFEVDVHDYFADAAEAKNAYNVDLLPSLDSASGYHCIVGAVAHDDYVIYDEADFARLATPDAVIADVKGMWRKTNLDANCRRWQL